MLPIALQKIIDQLDAYIAERKVEAVSHAKDHDLSTSFNGFFARHFGGFNAKEKCDAADKMKKLLLGEKVIFTDREQSILLDHRLGGIINYYRFNGESGERFLKKMG